VFTGFISSKLISPDYSSLTNEQRLHIINDLDTFSDRAYKQALLDCHIKYPRVVYAQAISEKREAA
jgi:ABC-type transporter MlaC component